MEESGFRGAKIESKFFAADPRVTLCESDVLDG